MWFKISGIALVIAFCMMTGCNTQVVRIADYEGDYSFELAAAEFFWMATKLLLVSTSVLGGWEFWKRFRRAR